MKRETTEAQAVKWLTGLKEAIPKGSDSITLKTVSIWSAHLTKITPDVLAASALVLVERHTFFPSLAEILEVCREINCQGRIPDAGEAYEEILVAMRRVGHWRPCPEFSHPAIGSALGAIGGWKYLCSSSNNISDRARFFEIYGKRREEAHREETMPEFSRAIAAKYLKQITDRAVASRQPKEPLKLLSEDLTEEQWEDKKRRLKDLR